MKAFSFILAAFSLLVSHPAPAALTEIQGTNFLTGKTEILRPAKTKKGLVVVFLSAQCPCSNSHVKELKELAGKYPEFSFVSIHSNADEAADMSKKYFEEAKLPFPVLQDPKSALADQLKAFKTPHAFLISTGGEILYQGGVTNSADQARATEHFLKEALDDVQAGRAVKTPQGRTLGCMISRSS